MCSISILRNNNLLLVGMNRDERRTRKPSTGIKKVEAPLGEVVYAEDTEQHGTWMAAHSNGVVICMLNYYSAQETTRPPLQPVTSRGLLVLQMAQSPNAENINQRMSDNPFAYYNPFRMLVIDSKQTVEWIWNGSSVRSNTTKGNTQFFSSSFVREKEVTEFRHERFQEWIKTVSFSEPLNELQKKMRMFHTLPTRHSPEIDILMSRELAFTHCYTEAFFTGENSGFEFIDLTQRAGQQ